MTYREPVRRRLRAGALILALIGLGVLTAGLVAPRLSGGLDPRAVPSGVPVPVPSSGLFGGGVALYGVHGERGRRPVPECELQVGAETRPIPATAVDALDRRVIGGRAVVPLLDLSSAPRGARILCAGPVTDRAQPLYLVPSLGVTEMVPMAAISLAGLALVLGLAGVVTLRRERG